MFLLGNNYKVLGFLIFDTEQDYLNSVYAVKGSEYRRYFSHKDNNDLRCFCVIDNKLSSENIPGTINTKQEIIDGNFIN